MFNTVKEKLGDVDVIAEDLGYLTESVIEMVKESGYPGMKVLQFAFDSREESDYLPHNYERNCVVYTGTHDNDTILGWYYVMSEEDREFSKEYMGNAKSTDASRHFLLPPESFVSMRKQRETCRFSARCLIMISQRNL